ncbi:hypothetical protein BGLA2_1760012 [Burkholderia gladioli]|nr:hypothetical protein BGLA2_1760012 [Burkholderia gladioli]
MMSTVERKNGWQLSEWWTGQSFIDPVSISRTAGILLISCMYGGLHVRKVSAETAIHGRVQD